MSRSSVMTRAGIHNHTGGNNLAMAREVFTVKLEAIVPAMARGVFTVIPEEIFPVI